jgi:hypothetical protein
MELGFIFLTSALELDQNFILAGIPMEEPLVSIG